ncbi:molybdopterin-dependent oxidoreductase [Glaciibacter superstes]|uniref:molybdopterin-dependent oxidoreductase n=1 Tax=Glaciibacter superstes TaxID=501023 RepID=UPI0003B66F43|nr:molybdopterin-dependent oxidoreductase [Glaciibacter superstes]
MLAVGSFVVDIVPRWAKEFAIATFGANDKVFLLGSIGLAVVIAAAIAGVLEFIKPPIGVVTLVLTGALSVAAIFTVAVAVASAVVGIGSRVISAATSSPYGIRDALRLPAPQSTVTVPPGADLDIPVISSLFTPNADFYRVDIALTVPSIHPAEWSLKVSGMVDHEVTLSFQDLLDLVVDEYVITSTCVSSGWQRALIRVKSNLTYTHRGYTLSV